MSFLHASLETSNLNAAEFAWKFAVENKEFLIPDKDIYRLRIYQTWWEKGIGLQLKVQLVMTAIY